MDVILEYILNNIPGLAVIIIVSIAVGYIIRRYTKWEYKHDDKHDVIDNSIKRNKNEHNDILSQTNEILRRIDLLERFLIKNGNANYNEFTQMNSPIQLNPLGRRLFEDSGADNFLNDKKEALLRILSSELSKIKNVTALDVQNCAYKICTDLSDNNDFKAIKDFIFVHPIYEEKRLSVGTICALIGGA